MNTFVEEEAVERSTQRNNKGNPINKKVFASTTTRLPFKGGNKMCGRCGSYAHNSDAKNCFALGKNCRRCGMRDHFARFCRENRKNKVNVVQDEEEEYERVLCVNEVGQNTAETEVKRMIRPKALFTIRDKQVHLMVDSGSLYTIIPNHMFEKNWPRVTLLPKDINPGGYQGEKIDILGFMHAQITFKDRSIEGKVYVSVSGPAILGWHHQFDLDITVSPRAPRQVMVVGEKSVEDIICAANNDGIFSEKLGVAKGYTHKIMLKPNAVPIQHKLRRVPVAAREKVKDILCDMVKDGVIEKIETSEWISPVVLTGKPDGSLRFCIDLRSLNQNIVTDNFPLPNINEMVLLLKGAEYFSKLDLRSAYHQVKLHSSSRHLTAFITMEGIFQFKRLPFGLASAASVFQRLMSEVLSGVKNILFYQDDILVYGDSLQSHNYTLDVVLDRIKSSGISLKKDKCVFGVKEVEYLGYTLGGGCVRPKRNLLEAIRRAPNPTDKDQLRSFLGLIEFYSKFIRNFAEKTENLRTLLRKGTSFRWGETQQETFEAIKMELVKANFLTPYDGSLDTVITVDASKVGIGAVLTQRHKGGERTVAFASRTLTNAERNYAVIEKEALAAAWGLEYFRNFIWGQKVTLKTDHKPLVKVLSPEGMGKISARLARIASRLQEYIYTVEYIPGWKNVQADCLSRLSLPWEEVDFKAVRETEEEGSVAIIDSVTSYTGAAVDRLTWTESMRKDATMKEAISMVKSGRRRESAVSMSVRPFCKILDELSNPEEDVLMRGQKFIPPMGVREKLMALAHQGHLGQTLTKKRVRENFWWPKMDSEIEEWVTKCHDCREGEKRLKAGDQGEFGELKDPGEPWHTICLDFIGPLSGVVDVYRFAMVIVDLHSKWLVVRFMKSITTKDTIKALKEVFKEEGFPSKIVTDNGTQLTSEEMSNFLRDCGIRHSRTSLYNPQGNGAVERANRMVKGVIQMAIASSKNMFEMVADLVWAYRTTRNGVTGDVPFEVMRGRKPKTKLTTSWMAEIVSGKHQLKDEGNSKFDKRIRVGDLVKVRSGRPGCGWRKFRGPYVVKTVHDYHIKLENGESWNKRNVALYERGPGVHQSKLCVEGRKSDDLNLSGYSFGEVSGASAVGVPGVTGTNPGGGARASCAEGGPELFGEGSGQASSESTSPGEKSQGRDSKENDRPRRIHNMPKYLQDYVH